MGFMEAVNSCFEQYFTFSGRASRSEYWYFVLFIVIVDLVLTLLADLVVGRMAGILDALFGLAVFLPSLAVGVRRLHDIDRSGWWLFIDLVPIVGFILILVWACTPGTKGANRFGLSAA